MDNQTNMRIITLKDLWDLFLHYLWVMILAAVVIMGVFFIYKQITFVPEYESRATLYILRQDNEETSTSSVASDFSLALNVVNDCTYLLKSHAVLDQVIEELSLDIEYDDLYDCISTANPDNTRILEVIVTADSPANAKKIVDKICEIGAGKIADAMGFTQVNLYEYGILDEEPSNQTGLIVYLLLGFIAGVLVYSVLLLGFLLNDSVLAEGELDKVLGLSILGEIPDANESKKHKYGYHGKGYGKIYVERRKHKRKKEELKLWIKR